MKAEKSKVISQENAGKQEKVVDESKVVSMDDHMYKRPIINEISLETITGITDEELEKLERVCKADGFSAIYFQHIRKYCTKFPELTSEDGSQIFFPTIKKHYDYNSVNMINALVLYMHRVYKKYTDKEIFIDAQYVVSESENEDGKSKYKVRHSHYEVDVKGLASYMVKERYKDIVFTSIKNLPNTKDNFYVYDINTSMWTIKSNKELKDIIHTEITTLLKGIGFKRSYIINIQNSIFEEMVKLFPKFDDTIDDMLESYTKKHPNLVQFKDIVYDIDTHSIAKSHPDFKLKHVHDYRIPTGTIDLDSIDSDGQSFVPLALSYQQIEAGCRLMIGRLGMLIKTDEMNFVLTFLGACFYHEAQQFQVTIALRGGGGLGKSFFFEDTISKYLYSDMVSSITQRDLDRNSQFTYSNLIGKEMNIIGEMKGTIMSESMIDMLKAVQSGGKVSIEFKNKQAYLTTVYSRTLMIANENQLPTIKTSDVQDSGLKRRIVVIDCKSKVDDIEWKKKYQLKDLVREIPSFALLCMMKFKENKENGNISNFHYYEGASKKVIDQFTTPSIVKSTKEYFNGHDRFRLFFNELPEIFVAKNEAERLFKENGSKIYDEYTEETFRDWLLSSKASYFNEKFKEWHEDEYSTRKGATTLKSYLKDKDINTIVRWSSVTNKTERVYNEKFADYVIGTIKEDNIEGFLDILKDQAF